MEENEKTKTLNTQDVKVEIEEKQPVEQVNSDTKVMIPRDESTTSLHAPSSRVRSTTNKESSHASLSLLTGGLSSEQAREYGIVFRFSDVR